MAPLTPCDALKVSGGAVGRDAESSEGTAVAGAGKLAAKALAKTRWYATMPRTVVAGKREKLEGDWGNPRNANKFIKAWLVGAITVKFANGLARKS